MVTIDISITLPKWALWLIFVVPTGLLLWWLVPAALSNPVSATIMFVTFALVATFASARKE